MTGKIAVLTVSENTITHFNRKITPVLFAAYLERKLRAVGWKIKHKIKINIQYFLYKKTKIENTILQSNPS